MTISPVLSPVRVTNDFQIKKQIAKPKSQSEDGKYVSRSVYWEDYYEHDSFSYEWNNGRLEEKPMPTFISYSMYSWFVDILHRFLEEHPIARPMGLDMGFNLPLSYKTTIRKPDLGVVLNNNPIPLGDRDKSYKGIFDLCIESLSYSSRREIERDVVQKMSEYEQGGVREYYILDDRGQHTTFYQRNQHGLYVPLQPVMFPAREGGDGAVIQSTVLPNFQFRIADLYKRPLLINLTEDVVYRDFIMLEYQATKAQVEKERQAKERERQAKEKIMAQLRALGIEPDL
jgi:Uma2 family endonuclease